MIVSPALRKSSAWSSGRWVLITRTLYKGQVTIYWLKGNNKQIGKQEIGRRMSKKKNEENVVRLLSLKCMRSVERSDRAAAAAARLAAKLLAEESFNHLQSIKSQFFLSPRENHTGGLLSLRENQITLQKVYSSLSCSSRTPTF